jgi:hypothetical protein
MSKLAELSHKWWIEAQLSAPPLVQQMVIPRLHKAKEIVRLVKEPYLTLYQWQGQNEAGRLTVSYAGLGYAKSLLRQMLFPQGSSEKEVGRIPAWRLEGLANVAGSDMTIVEISKHLIRKLPHQKAIILPFRIRYTLDLRGEWLDIEERFHRNVRRNARKAHGYESYEYEISHRKEDLEMFYHTMYLPTVHARHGELADILPEREAYQLLRYGWLFLVKQEGDYVCGSLGYAKYGAVEFKEMGVRNGDMNLMRQGVVEAMNYLRIRWANQQGYQALSFGDSWPYLSGIFQAKRKWGSAVSISTHEHKRIWLIVQRNTPAIVQFLQNNPCVICDEQGKLYGFIVTPYFDAVTPEMEMEWYKLYATPGFTGLLVCSPTDLATRRLYNGLFHG